MGLISIEWHTLHSRYISSHSTVIDLGANYGRFAAQISQRFDCHCFAVEPSPQVYSAIETSDRLQKLNLAITAEPGPTRFAVRDSSLASSLSSIGSESEDTVVVEGVTLEQLLTLLGLEKIDVLKCDIEGAEVEMLDSAPDHILESIGQISIEFHDFCGITAPSEVTRILQRLKKLGFYPIRMSRIGHQDTFLINRKLCPISYLELLYLRFIFRNWAGLLRVACRTYGTLHGRIRGTQPGQSTP